MNEDLKARLIESMDKVQEYVEATGDFVVEQAPLVAQEIVQLGRVATTFQALCFAAGALFCYLIYRKLWRAFVDSEPSEEESEKNGKLSPCYEYAVAGVIFWGVSMGLTVFSLINIKSALLPWLAPRLYLLQELKK